MGITREIARFISASRPLAMGQPSDKRNFGGKDGSGRGIKGPQDILG